MAARVKARFVEPMLLLCTEMLPMILSAGSISSSSMATAPITFKTAGILHVRSSNDSDFTGR